MTNFSLVARWVLLPALTVTIALTAGAADRPPVKTSVYSRVDPAYKRKQLKDGKF